MKVRSRISDKLLIEGEWYEVIGNKVMDSPLVDCLPQYYYRLANHTELKDWRNSSYIYFGYHRIDGVLKETAYFNVKNFQTLEEWRSEQLEILL